MPIEQHPIPQDISNYRFRLVGDMTLKQFLELAGGIVLAFITWSIPLPFFFKIPLVVIFAFLGIGLAFIPIEGRPLEQWIIAFIKSIYSPTIYSWQKTESPKIEDIQLLHPNQNPPTQAIPSSPLPPPTPKTPPPSIPISQIADSEPKTSTTSPTLPIPVTSTVPNTLNGLVITPDQKIIDGAIIEISQNGNTTRATKTNKLGQFLFARPLDNGSYQIKTEKDGHLFDSYTLTLTGQIIPPLKLQSKS
jgi:hypothetical protein